MSVIVNCTESGPERRNSLGSFLYTENPTLGVGFNGAKGGEDDKKLLLLIMEVRSANCTTKSKRRSSDDGE